MLILSSQIVDDDYPHALRVYQDRVSGAVRLQASVHKGIMDRSVRALVIIWPSLTDFNSTPVWTAFVTHQLKRRSWLKPLDSRTVAVRDLKLTILMSAEDYNPPTTNNGEHILKFTSRSGAYAPHILVFVALIKAYLDADGFLETMKDIAMTIR